MKRYQRAEAATKTLLENSNIFRETEESVVHYTRWISYNANF